MLAATIGVAYGAGVHDGAASHSCIEPTSKPFGDGEMLTEFCGVNLALLCGCPFGVCNRLADLHRLPEWGDWFGSWYSTVTHKMGATLNVGPCDDAFTNGAVHRDRALENAVAAIS
jgi:hypothetical protein